MPLQLGERPPRTVQDVIRLVEEGRVAAPDAFQLMQQLDGPTARAVADRPLEAARRVQAVMEELDALVGLDKVKELVRELQAFVEVQRRRAAAGLVTDPLVLHMIFRGNPGTGKTTIARLLGRLFKEMGVLQKGHLVEVERADIVGEYIGHTAQKTREHLRRALGGVLFIDEAYSLARGGEKDFGKEAIDCLVKTMEDQKDNLVVILAGYRDEMKWFLRANPGLRSRFPIHIDFPDYTVDELLRIAEHMVHRRQYVLTDEARQLLDRALRAPERQSAIAGGNARFVRNLIERAMRRQAVRLVRHESFAREELMRLTPADLEAAIAS